LHDRVNSISCDLVEVLTASEVWIEPVELSDVFIKGYL
jgi:hypothetical protein